MVEIPASILIPCVLGTVCIAWLSILQTRLFVYESIFSETKLARPIFLISDFLTSTNIFFFLFSAVLAASLAVFQLINLGNTISASSPAFEIKVLRAHHSIVERFGFGSLDEDFLFLVTMEVAKDKSDTTSRTVNFDTMLTLASDHNFFAAGSFFGEEYVGVNRGSAKFKSKELEFEEALSYFSAQFSDIDGSEKSSIDEFEPDADLYG